MFISDPDEMGFAEVPKWLMRAILLIIAAIVVVVVLVVFVLA